MRKFRLVLSFVVLPLLAMIPAFAGSVPLAAGQTANSSSPGESEPVSLPQRERLPEATSSRIRGVAPPSSQQTPAENSTAAETTQISNHSTVPDSEIAALRHEINLATNEQARAGLRLKLVSKLVSAELTQQAIDELVAMSEEDRFDPQGFYNIANAQARLGELETAVKIYRKAIQQRNGRYSRASNNLGVVLLRQGRLDEAHEALMSALRHENFHYAEASFNLGRLYAARGENDRAVREWRRAVAVNPGHEAAAKALSREGYTSNIVVTTSATRSNRGAFTRRTATKPSTSTAEEIKPTGVRTTKPRRVARRPLPAYTIDLETYALLKRGRTARERGQNEVAVENYRQVLARLGGYFPPANLDLGYALLTLKRNDEAMAILLPVTVKDGHDIPISYYHVGRLYEVRGELKLAEDYYSRAAEVYGESDVQFILDVARVREKQGNLAGALLSMEQYIAAMEQHGRKPEWSTERLNTLRQKLAASQPKP